MIFAGNAKKLFGLESQPNGGDRGPGGWVERLRETHWDSYGAARSTSLLLTPP